MTDESPPTLYLIDGHAQMFRAYYAIRGGMTSPITGEPTNALFAFTGMLLKLFKDCRPPYAAMIVDSPGKTFRDEFYPEYKANRDAPDDDFVKQIPRMFELARLFGLPIIEKPGYEADDIMATVATRLDAGDFDTEAPGITLKLVAKDKDLEQVLSDRVTMYDVQTDETLDTDGLIDKRGIRPEQVIDYQTLIGDSTDNIPGVKGIGPKTAVKLIDQFGSVDDLVANLDQLKGKQKENLENAASDGTIELTRKLVTLERETPVGFDLSDTRTDGLAKIDGPALLELFRTLGFNRHVSDLRKLLGLGEESAAQAAALKKKKPKPEAGIGGLFGGVVEDEEEETEGHTIEASGNYGTITTQEQLGDLVETLKRQALIAIDTETVGLGRKAALAGVCLAWEEGSGVYIPTRSPEPNAHLDTATVVETLRPVLEDPSVTKCGHNIKYDLHVLRNALGPGEGVTLRGVAFDSMIGAFLSGAPGRGMDDLALSELGHTCIPISQLIGPRPSRKSDPQQKTIDQVPLSQVTDYAAEDADITLRLCNHFRKQLEGMAMADLAAEVEMPLIEVLTAMEANGIRCDPGELDSQHEGLQVRIGELRSDILNAARVDFNPDSPKQLGDVLFNQLGFPTIKKTKTGFSTDVEVMEKLADRAEMDELPDVPEHARVLPALMLEYRMLTKLVSTYLLNLKADIDPDDGRVHTTFVQTGAATGRLASNNPNLQNIPIRTEVGRQVRKAFVAEPGHTLIAADYSQIELRVLAHLSEDQALIEAFRGGQDIHTAVAAQVFDTPPDEVTSEQRGHAKTINFGIIYGVTAYGLARRIDNLDNEGAAELIAGYKKRFPGIDRFLAECVEQALNQGFVTTILGRRRAIPEIHSRNGQHRQLGERLAINSVVQGSAADLIKVAMVNLHNRIRDEKLPMKLLLQIHDELVAEAPADQADAMAGLMREEMENAMTLSVPLSVEAGMGESWFETK